MAKGKRIVITTLERGLHEDLERGDAFNMQALGELARGLFDDRRFPYQWPGLAVRTSTLETPLRAHVLSGLMVRVDNGAYLLVDPGTLLAAIPGTADDSIVEIVEDDVGVFSNSVLPFVANAAGSVRLDIVECQVNDTVRENATRGIFNPSTRVFDPTAVPKVSAPILSYRIRQGVAGAGLPAAANGWLPLAVVCHQPGTTSFADCDFWDVRPLVADRVQFGSPRLDPVGGVSHFEQQVRGRWRADNTNKLKGFAWGQFDGYIAGGMLALSSAIPIVDHGLDWDSISANSALNQDPAFALTANTLVHLAACFPGGLPRWVRYTDNGAAGVSGSRVPKGPRGILVFTNDKPTCNGSYAAVTLPVANGFTADAPGISLLALMVSNTGNRAVGVGVNEHVYFEQNVTTLLPGIAGVGSNQVKWTFSPVAGVVVPPQAKTIDLEFNLDSGTFGNLEIFVKRQNSEEILMENWLHVAAAAGTAKFTMRGIPLSCDLPWTADGGGLADQTYIQINGVAAFTAAEAKIVGYGT